MTKDDKYTDPELRNEVKEEIHQSDKGGAPGQWSARKVISNRIACSDSMAPLANAKTSIQLLVSARNYSDNKLGRLK